MSRDELTEIIIQHLDDDAKKKLSSHQLVVQGMDAINEKLNEMVVVLGDIDNKTYKYFEESLGSLLWVVIAWFHFLDIDTVKILKSISPDGIGKHSQKAVLDLFQNIKKEIALNNQNDTLEQEEKEFELIFNINGCQISYKDNRNIGYISFIELDEEVVIDELFLEFAWRDHKYKIKIMKLLIDSMYEKQCVRKIFFRTICDAFGDDSIWLHPLGFKGTVEKPKECFDNDDTYTVLKL